MFSYRPVIFVSLIAFCLGVNASAQMFPGQSQPLEQQRMQQQPIQQPQIQQQQIQQPPIQAPLFGTQGSSVYQNPLQSTPRQAAQPVAQPSTSTPPVLRVANASATAPLSAPTGQPVLLYGESGAPQVPLNVQPPAARQGIPPGMQHMGRAEPASRIIPFFLNDDEKRVLDEFLARWERYSTDIKLYEAEFNLLEYDPSAQGAVPNVPQKTLFGSFKYIANPKRFYYHVEGEYRDGRFVKREGDKNPHIFAEKIIIDEKSVTKYDYNARTVHRINVPPEMIGKGIADSPLPLIFGAKADELKRRFSMNIVHRQDGNIHLYARPLLIEDQQEFRELEVLLDGKTLRALGLQQHDINGKAYKTFQLKSTKVHTGLVNFDIIRIIREFFTADTPFGWKLEVHAWTSQPPPPPPPAPAMPQMQVANPQMPPQNRHEFPLYQGHP
jgi:TIGR03009 family protein